VIFASEDPEPAKNYSRDTLPQNLCLLKLHSGNVSLSYVLIVNYKISCLGYLEKEMFHILINSLVTCLTSAMLAPYPFTFSSSSSGTELPLVVESYGLPNDIFPFPSILDAGYPVFNLHLANVLFDVIFPSVLGSYL